MNTHYDSIVIGSGAGGLAAALALAQAGQKVLLCEKHKVAGGWTHSFSKSGYKFNTGVHYVGDLHKGGELRKIYEGLGVSDDLIFMEMNPDAIDHMYIGTEKFDIPKGVQEYINRLIDRFPAEKKGIKKFFAKMDDIHQLASHFTKGDCKYIIKNLPDLLWLRKTAGQFVDKYLKDPLLKGIVSAQIGIHGMPPNRLSAPFFIGGIQHYFNGGYHPYKGGMSISRAFLKKFDDAGGEVRLGSAVSKILVKDQQAIGIELETSEQITAQYIISNADPSITYMNLVGDQHLSRKLRKKINNIRYSTSCLSLFLAVKLDLRKMGYDSGNYWLYDHADMNQIYELGYTNHAALETPSALFVTITTLKDPAKLKDGHHQLEVFTMTGYDAFKKWANKPKGNRGEDYEKFKNDITERMLDRLELSFPGIKSSIVFKELATPLTNKHYVNAPYGNLYGIEKSVNQIGPGSFSIQTEIKNLYLCGASTHGQGIAPCTKSGLVAASKVLDCSSSQLLDKKGRELRIYQAEDPGSWPNWLSRML